MAVNRLFIVREVRAGRGTGWEMHIPIVKAKTPEGAEAIARRYCVRKLGVLKITKRMVSR